MHVDELESGHVIGSILHIARNLADGRDWPLEVIDFGGTPRTIVTSPGDMVMFEAARLPHGRPEVFEGNFYVNVFFYYRPTWDWHSGQSTPDPATGHSREGYRKPSKIEL